MLANRTVTAITIEIAGGGELPKDLTIPSDDSQPIFFQRSLAVRFGEGLRRQQYPLEAGNAYSFTRNADGKSLELEQIGLGEQSAVGANQGSLQPRLLSKTQPVIITVQLLVDENEPTHRKAWEPKLRKSKKLFTRKSWHWQRC